MAKEHPDYKKELVDVNVVIFFGETHINLKPRVIEYTMKFFLGEDYLTASNEEP